MSYSITLGITECENNAKALFIAEVIKHTVNHNIDETIKNVAKRSRLNTIVDAYELLNNVDIIFYPKHKVAAIHCTSSEVIKIIKKRLNCTNPIEFQDYANVTWTVNEIPFLMEARDNSRNCTIEDLKREYGIEESNEDDDFEYWRRTHVHDDIAKKLGAEDLSNDILPDSAAFKITINIITSDTEAAWEKAIDEFNGKSDMDE